MTLIGRTVQPSLRRHIVSLSDQLSREIGLRIGVSFLCRLGKETKTDMNVFLTSLSHIEHIGEAALRSYVTHFSRQAEPVEGVDGRLRECLFYSVVVGESERETGSLVFGCGETEPAEPLAAVDGCTDAETVAV